MDRSRCFSSIWSRIWSICSISSAGLMGLVRNLETPRLTASLA